LAIRRKTDAEDQTVLGEEISYTSAPLLGELSRVRSRYQAMIRMLSEMPGGIQNAPVGRFRRTRRHEHSKTVNIARRDLLELADQETMMRGRLKASVPAPVS
jgi:hypothetical protein